MEGGGRREGGRKGGRVGGWEGGRREEGRSEGGWEGEREEGGRKERGRESEERAVQGPSGSYNNAYHLISAPIDDSCQALLCVCNFLHSCTQLYPSC